MSLRVCLDCTTAFAVGVLRCPHCGSERHAEEGSAAALGVRHGVPVGIEEEDMPKITRHGGASAAGEEPALVEGGEDVSAGKDSSTSSEKQQKKSEPSTTGPRKRARTTESHSRQGRTAESSTARGATTGGPETDAADA